MLVNKIKLDQRAQARLEVVCRVERGELRQKEAARLLGVCVRRFRQILKRYQEEGPVGLRSRRYGRTPGNKIPDAVRRSAMAILRQPVYKEFGPTLASECLAERHGCRVSKETLRQWMIAAGLWQARSRGDQPEHPPRDDKRAQRGDLVEIDGSPHKWFEERGPACTLIVFVDDATGALLALRFVPAETTQAYMEVLGEYLKQHGRPVSLYSDKHSVFRVNRRDCEGELTQFTRALKTLDIEAIHANTPQAKGGVERANRTLQDRMVKLMRLDGVNNMEEGNAWLPGFMAKHNARFATAPADPRDAHRPVLQDSETLARILCLRHERALTRDLTFRLHHRQYQVQTPGKGYGLRGAKITVCEDWDGNITVLYRSKVRPVRLLAEGEPPIPLADRKTVSHRVDQAKAEQAQRPRWKPAPDHPWRQYKNRQTPPGSATL